ncbi:Serine palmitoyltransferase 2 [Branchiostoma belcheri]|nr:Serine palmitoyltransferase 2 [Branchiostoma belcheri]
MGPNLNENTASRVSRSLHCLKILMDNQNAALGRRGPTGFHHMAKVADDVRLLVQQNRNADLLSVLPGRSFEAFPSFKRNMLHKIKYKETTNKRERAAEEAESRKSGAVGTWSWEAIKEVESWPDGKVVSWRAYAKEKGVHNKQGKPASNGGQIIQDWLVQEGVNIHRFQSAVKSQNTTTPRQ